MHRQMLVQSPGDNKMTCVLFHFLSMWPGYPKLEFRVQSAFRTMYHGLPKFQISKLQWIQNSSARLITCIPYHEHLKPVLMQLHWLPVSERVQFKVLLLSFMAIKCLAPSYISELVHIKQSQQSARSATVRRLVPVVVFPWKMSGSAYHMVGSANTILELTWKFQIFLTHRPIVTLCCIV